MATQTYKAVSRYRDDDLKQTNPAAYSAIRSYQDDYEAARLAGDRAGMDAAHAAAEDIRHSYGYRTHEDGSGYIPVAAVSSGGEQLLEEARDRAEAQLEADRESRRAQSGAQYDALQKQAYVTRMQTEQSLPLTLASLGYSGGLAEMTALAARTDYQNVLAELGKSREEAYRAIDRASSEQALELALEFAGKLLNARQFDASLLQKQLNADADRAAERESEQRTLAYQAARDSAELDYKKQVKQAELAYKKQRDAAGDAAKGQTAATSAFRAELSRAELAAKYGDFSLLRALGIDADAYERAYLEKGGAS